MAGVTGSGAALPSMLATDVRGLEALRGKAAADPKAAVKQAARQFEALFMQQLMKSMRATTMAGADGIAGAGTSAALGTEMLDQHLHGGWLVVCDRLERNVRHQPADFLARTREFFEVERKALLARP